MREGLRLCIVAAVRVGRHCRPNAFASGLASQCGHFEDATRNMVDAAHAHAHAQHRTAPRKVHVRARLTCLHLRSTFGWTGACAQRAGLFQDAPAQGGTGGCCCGDMTPKSFPTAMPPTTDPLTKTKSTAATPGRVEHCSQQTRRTTHYAPPLHIHHIRSPAAML